MSGLIICYICGRLGTRGYVISSGTGDGRDTYTCANSDACYRRERRASKAIFRAAAGGGS